MNASSALTAVLAAIALVMTVLVVRVVLRERRRSAARVAALEAEIYRTNDEDIVVLHDPASQLTSALPALFEPARRLSAPIVPVLVVGMAVIAGIAIGALRYRLISGESPAQTPTPATTQALELLSLDQERSDDRLTVRGVVRNPERGSEMDHLTAVVLLFNQQGGFLTSARSPLESGTLEPGSEAKFVVTVPAAADVGKYRVSFRTDERVVPHVDRRW